MLEMMLNDEINQQRHMQKLTKRFQDQLYGQAQQSSWLTAINQLHLCSKVVQAPKKRIGPQSNK